MLGKVWQGGLCALVALIVLGCAGQTGTDSRGLAKPESTPVGAPTQTPVVLDPSAATTPLRPPASESPATPAPMLPPALEPSPTPVPEATLPATAEDPSPPSPPSRSAPTAQPYVAQPIPLHPLQPAAGRARVVALDPGHGGAEVGAGGAGLAEKDVNLSIALKLKSLLEQDGMKVVLTRDSDRRAYVPQEGQNTPNLSASRQDLQARMDIANQARADAFISIHNNGSNDPNQSGTEVWYDGKRPFADFNKALAEDVLDAVVARIRGTGYAVANRGLKEDSQYRTYQGQQFPLFVLGPPRTGSTNTRATEMPAILGETLFLSNPYEASQLKRDSVIAAVVAGYRDGLTRYFSQIDGGELALPPEGLQPEVPNRYVFRSPTPGSGR